MTRRSGRNKPKVPAKRIRQSQSRRERVTADDARTLADSFELIADELRQWRRENARHLSNEEIRHLRNLQLAILHFADMMTTTAVGLTLDRAAVDLDQIVAATTVARDAIRAIETTKKLIEIAAAAITLGTAILAKDIGATAKAAAALYTLVTDDDRTA